DQILFYTVADTGRIPLCDLTIVRNLNGWIDNIFAPVTLAGRHVARERKVFETRKRDIVGASYSRLQHSATPDRNPALAANVMNRSYFPMPANASQFDVDDFAGANPDRFPRILGRVDRLIETDRSFNLPLKLRVIDDVLIMQRLLEHHDVVAVHFLESLDIGQRIGRIGLRLQQNRGKAFTALRDNFNVPAWFDFDLDPPVTGFDFDRNLFQELIDAWLNSDRHSTIDAFPHAAQHFPQRRVLEL